MPAGVSGEQHHSLPETIAFDRVAQQPPHDRPVGSVVGRQRFGRYAIEPCQKRRRLTCAPVHRGEANVGDAVVIVAHAQRGGIFRSLAE